MQILVLCIYCYHLQPNSGSVRHLAQDCKPASSARQGDVVLGTMDLSQVKYLFQIL